MNRCFVIGPIGDRMAPLGSERRLAYEDALAVFEEVIKPACEANDLDPVRADGIAVPGEITDQIFRHLYEDEVVIADVSGGNPNVMYELGLRHTRDLLTIQIGEYGQLPFDVQALRTIMFSRSERGLIDARKQLEQVIRVGLSEGSDTLPATKIWTARGAAEIGLDAPLAEVDDAGNEESPAFEDDRGLLERLNEIEEAFPVLNESMEAITAVLEQLGRDADNATAEIGTIDSNAPTALRLTLIAKYGESLREPANQLTEHTARFAKIMTDLDANVRGIFSEIEADPGGLLDDDALAFIDSIIELGGITRESMSELSEFGATVGSLGRISKALRQPGKQMAGAVKTMASAAALIDEWESQATKLRAVHAAGS